jgi:hypothetical protein
MEKRAQLLQPPEVTTSIGEVKESARPLIKEIQRIPRRVKKLIAKLPHQEVLWISHFPYMRLLDYSSCEWCVV